MYEQSEHSTDSGDEGGVGLVGPADAGCAVRIVESWRFERSDLVRNGLGGRVPPPRLRWGFEYVHIYCPKSDVLKKQPKVTSTRHHGKNKSFTFGFQEVSRPWFSAPFLRSRQLSRAAWPVGC